MKDERIGKSTELLKALAHENRRKILENINDKSLDQIKTICGISRTGLQTHIDMLKNTRLIEKKGKKFKRTEIGDEALKLFKMSDDIIQKADEFVKEEVRMAVLKSPLSVKDLEVLIKETRKRRT